MAVRANGFVALAAQAQADLAHLSAAVATAVPLNVQSWAINPSQLPGTADGLDLLNRIAAWAGSGKRCLYTFECGQGDLAAAARAYAAAKDNDGDRAWARLNDHVGDSFYVGSSQSIAKRVAEHLGYGARQTYALHLRHWARDLGLTLDLVCAQYPDDTPLPVLQALEDALWQARRPMFGRQGRR